MVLCSDCKTKMRWKSQISIGEQFTQVLVQCPNCKRIDVVSNDEAREP
jgi:hypothetical protein